MDQFLLNLKFSISISTQKLDTKSSCIDIVRTRSHIINIYFELNIENNVVDVDIVVVVLILDDSVLRVCIYFTIISNMQIYKCLKK